MVGAMAPFAVRGPGALSGSLKLATSPVPARSGEVGYPSACTNRTGVAEVVSHDR